MEEKGWEEEGKEEEKEEEREFEEEEEKAGERSPSSRVQAGGETTGRTASGFFSKPDKPEKQPEPVSVEMTMISSDTYILFPKNNQTKLVKRARE